MSRQGKHTGGMGFQGRMAHEAVTHRPVHSAPEITAEKIRLRAYEIYQARKGAPGDPAADWLQAERELKAGVQRTGGPAGPGRVEANSPSRGDVLLHDPD